MDSTTVLMIFVNMHSLDHGKILNLSITFNTNIHRKPVKVHNRDSICKHLITYIISIQVLEKSQDSTETFERPIKHPGPKPFVIQWS